MGAVAELKQKITPFLWFDANAEDAARFYVDIFDDSRIVEATPMIVVFELCGQRFMGLNGGPKFSFNEAVSLYVSCEDQAEVDRYWDALLADGGEESMCGWLRDRHGLFWQIIPEALPRLIGNPDREKADRAVQAMLKMRRIDVAALEAAFAGE